jgi:uncharacterized ferritin-like protein (DUF455 family)
LTGDARALASELFAAGPARDSRFVVKERWAECLNLADGHPAKELEFLHRQMNEELNGLENSARCLSDFPAADWELRLGLARQCADEARHARMFRRLLERRGGRVGDYPVMNFQFRIVSRIGDLAGRLAVQNRSFEADGVDAVGFALEAARGRGDTDLAALFDAQLADEIGHVRFANRWIRELAARTPRTVLEVVRALSRSARAFAQVVGREGGERVEHPVDRAGRLEAGFRPDEVGVAAARAASRGRPARAREP